MAIFAPWELSRRFIAVIGADFALAWVGATAGELAMRQMRLAEVPRHGIALTAAVLAALWLIALYFHDFYTPHRARQPARLVVDLISAAALTSLMVVALAFMVPALNLGRRFYGMALLADTVLLIAWRLALGSLLARWFVSKVLVIGDGERAKLISQELERHGHLGYQLVDFVALESLKMPKLAAGVGSSAISAPRPVSIAGTEAIGSEVRTVVLADPNASPIPTRQLLMWRICGVDVVDFESFYERLTGRLPLSQLRESWLIVAPGFLRSTPRECLKRVVDVIAASLLAILTLPVAALIAVAIKLDSPGPVIYRQKRVGQNGRVFDIYKFRSMYHNAEALSGPVWAKAQDPRITRVGRVIRKLRLDELPQLVNVLKGDLSIVGPRPERPELVPRLAQEIPFYEYRHVVKPGLTGWAQVCYPYGSTIKDAEEKLSYDLYYVKNRSLIFDLQIIVQTIKVVLFGRGAR